jgi:hypothetical protein
MSIKAYVDELEQIQYEIKANNKRNTLLRVRVKELENNISEYLAEKGQHGLKYKGRAIMVEQQERRPTKKKKERDAVIISLFEDLGVSEPEAAYSRLKDVQKGEPIAETKLKFKKLPKEY